MEWMQNFSTILTWAQTHWMMLTLTGFVFLQFVALQALLIHYSLFRRSLQRPRPDGLRFKQIEQTISFQAEQIEKLFEKFAEIRKDILQSSRGEVKQGSVELKPLSVESSYLSMGEINLKKKLAAFKLSRPI